MDVQDLALEMSAARLRWKVNTKFIRQKPNSCLIVARWLVFFL